MKKVNSSWKTAAIILGMIVILYTALLYYGYTLSDKEEKCSGYCYINEYESYNYDIPSGLCSCYIGDEIKEQIKI